MTNHTDDTNTNTNTNTSDTDTGAEDLSLNSWLKAAERLIAVERASIFEREGVTKRDWRILKHLGQAHSDSSHSDNSHHDNPHAHRPHAGRPKLRELRERGVITKVDGRWVLTAEGLALRERIETAVEGLTSTVTEALTPDELNSTLASLRKITIALGWDENTPLPRRQHRGPHRGPWARRPQVWSGRGYGREEQFGAPNWPSHPFAHGQRFPDDANCRPHPNHWHPQGQEHAHGHPGRPGHTAAHRLRMSQFAFERGFDTGFARGQRGM